MSRLPVRSGRSIVFLQWHSVDVILNCFFVYFVLFVFLFTDIVSRRIVHFILLHEDVSLQYFIPALA